MVLSYEALEKACNQYCKSTTILSEAQLFYSDVQLYYSTLKFSYSTLKCLFETRKVSRETRARGLNEDSAALSKKRHRQGLRWQLKDCQLHLAESPPRLPA